MFFALSPFILFFTSYFIVPDLTIEVKAPGPLLEKYRQDIGDDMVVISDENTITAVCWYLHRSDVYLLGDGGELDYGLVYDDASGRSMGLNAAADLIRRNRGKTLLVARMKNIRRWRDQLPKPVFQADSGPRGYAFWRY